MPSQSRILPKLVDESLKMGRSPDNLGGSNDILPKKKS